MDEKSVVICHLLALGLWVPAKDQLMVRQLPYETNGPEVLRLKTPSVIEGVFPSYCNM